MENFNTLGLSEVLLRSIEAMGFTKPTPIQAQTIPLALQGKDVLGTAQTGTGKTAAFGIPLVNHLQNNEDATALVLAPTRELALQVLEAIKKMVGFKTRCSLLIGGDSMFKQLQQLRQGPRIIVGTPGRVNDHLARGTLSLDRTGFLVLDEMDRMLDIGFSVQLERIAEFLPAERQTLMFSATISKSVEKMAANYLKDAVRISVGSTSSPITKIKQDTVRIAEKDKYEMLLKNLNEFEGASIVFVKTKINAERMADRLSTEGLNVDVLHGGLRQRNRDNVIRAFRNKKTHILVATDVAARGLDIPHIEHVINYDMPPCPEDYIHRIGRTGRADAEGHALNFLAPIDELKWRAICRLIDPQGKEANAPYRGPSSESRGPSRGGFKGGRAGGRSFDKPSGRFGDKPSGGRSFKDRPARDDSFKDRAPRDKDSRDFGFNSDRKPFERSGDRPFAKKEGSFSRDQKPYGKKYADDKSGSDRPWGERPARSKPYGDKPAGDKPWASKGPGKGSDKPYAKKPGKAWGNKPREHSAADKPDWRTRVKSKNTKSDKPLQSRRTAA